MGRATPVHAPAGPSSWFQSTPGPDGPGDKHTGNDQAASREFQSTPGPDGPGDSLFENTTDFARLRPTGREGCSARSTAAPPAAAPRLHSSVFKEQFGKREGIGYFMSTLPSRGLDDEGALEVDAWLDTVVFGATQVVLAQKVEAQTIFVRVE